MLKKWLIIALSCAIAATVASGAETNVVPAAAPPTVESLPATAGAPTDTPPLTTADLKSFLDGLVPYALARGDIAGATIAVVKDGQLVLAHGYGYADVKSKAPVVADRTLFRPGSVSKLFTWTAVMQLVEQGKLDLDRDVNTYLDFKIPKKFGKPITLRNCLTHTPGFEETITDLFVNKPEELYPLRDYLIRRMPERIYPPGEVVAYSNYATTLAGYIVQRVSGEKFEDYIANHIFRPLGMTQSTFAQPLPEALKPLMATGYRQASVQQTVPFELVLASPAGGLTSTATDMARFMLAHLAGGRLGDVEILKSETVKLMHTTSYSPAPGMNGMALGFYDENRNGHRIIGHAGDTGAFHSDLHLIVDAGTGVFMSFNSTGKEGSVVGVRTALFRNFLDRYFPYAPPVEATVEDSKLDATKVAGFYKASRRKETNLRLLSMLGQSAVAAEPDGTIKVDALRAPNGEPKSWRQVGPLTYREVDGQTHLKFVADARGDVLFWISDDFIPVEIVQRVRGLEEFGQLKTMGSAFIGILLLTLVIWLGGWAVRLRHGVQLKLTAQQFRWRLASRLGVVMFLLLIFGWLAFFTVLSTTYSAIVGDALNSWFLGLSTLGALSLLGGLAMIANGAMRAVQGPGGILARGGEIVLALAAVYGIWGVIDLGLANFNTNF